MQSDVRVREVQTFRVPTACRTPLKFGAVVVEKTYTGYARVTVENRAGRTGVGWGAMFLMDLWAWPVSKASHEARERAMADLFDAYAACVAGFNRFAHPIDIFMETEGELRPLAAQAAARHTPDDAMPFLAALVVASPIDHAVHDAFGRAAGIDSYRGMGPDHMAHDLARYLGDAYRGVYPSQFLRQDYLPRVPVFHLVGGLDVLREEDVPPGLPDDGVPNSFQRWIERDGVFCLKVKLRGKDLEWDVARTLEVSRIYHEVRQATPRNLPPRPHLTADTNEQCAGPEYIVEYLAKVREASPEVFDEILYIEQPTERDLAAHRWDMRPIARLKPVLIDESLTTVDDFRLAMELGWSGIALKSCKCLSSDMLFVPMAEMAAIPYAVQDLTNPSLALLESVGLAARTHTIMGVEANSRQFFPAANEAVAKVHRGLTDVRDGYAYTASMTGPGLGYRVDELDLAAMGL
ncbi:MAG TPA: mandelate racemase/muconate lactonizing enzyme family protein [Phycisphaerae bacterium]|nr:mandelate racemase/muconate lactonizing enzyme family protein [Phycisphaerae bacterium]